MEDSRENLESAINADEEMRFADPDKEIGMTEGVFPPISEVCALALETVSLLVHDRRGPKRQRTAG